MCMMRLVPLLRSGRFRADDPGSAPRGRWWQALVDDPRLVAAAIPVAAIGLFVVKGGGF